MIIRAAPWAHFMWLVERAGCTASTEFKAIEAVDENGRIHGMVGFDGWTENSVVMNIALDNPASFRHLLRPTFEYAFLQAKRGVALCMVRATNTRSARLCQKVGFREAYRVKDGICVGEDMILFEMRREECRWIPQPAPETRKVA